MSFPGAVMEFHEDFNYLLGFYSCWSYSLNSFDEVAEKTSGDICFLT